MYNLCCNLNLNNCFVGPQKRPMFMNTLNITVITLEFDQNEPYRREMPLKAAKGITSCTDIEQMAYPLVNAVCYENAVQKLWINKDNNLNDHMIAF